MLYIVDLRDCMFDHANLPALHEVYKYYPLKDIIGNLLEPMIDYQEMIWYEVETRVNPDLDMIDLDALDLFFELLIQDLDQHMESRIPGYDPTDFKLVEWINPTTVLLRELK